MRIATVLVLVATLVAGSDAVRAAEHEPEPTISFVGVARGQTDLVAAGLGGAGHWFPQFAAPAPVEGRPTGENVRAALPSWVAPLNHWGEPTDVGCTPAEILAGCLPSFGFRSFSQDGPARSSGGHAGWSNLRLPGGEAGISGAIVDPHTRDRNNNNTINRIQLREGIPAVFYVSIVTDNTARRHDPAGTLLLRGNLGTLDTDETQVEATSQPQACHRVFDGVPDVYTFRVEGFSAGDYLKLRLAAAPGTAEGASFGGLLFDDESSWTAVDRSATTAAC